jgi:hypothetical protein
MDKVYLFYYNNDQLDHFVDVKHNRFINNNLNNIRFVDSDTSCFIGEYNDNRLIAYYNLGWQRIPETITEDVIPVFINGQIYFKGTNSLYDYAGFKLI